jgi:hypothetical protein
MERATGQGARGRRLVQVTNIGHLGQEYLAAFGFVSSEPPPLLQRNQGVAAKTHDTRHFLPVSVPIFRHRPTLSPSPAPGQQQQRLSSKSWSSSAHVNNRSRLSRSHEIVRFHHRRFSGETTKDSRSAKTRRGPIPSASESSPGQTFSPPSTKGLKLQSQQSRPFGKSGGLSKDAAWPLFTSSERGENNTASITKA